MITHLLSLSLAFMLNITGFTAHQDVDHSKENIPTQTPIHQEYNLPDKQVLEYSSTEPTNLSEQGKLDQQHILQVAKYNNEQGTLTNFDRKVISNIQKQSQVGIEEFK